MAEPRRPIVTRSGAGVEHGHAGGAHSYTALSAAQNPVGVAVQFATMPEGAGPPFHRHPSFDEVFIILEGRVEFQAGDEVHTLGPGDLIHVPGEVPHAPRCVEGPAKLIMLVTPARFENFFHELGDALAKGGRDAMISLGARYGIEFLDRPAARQQHGEG
ncbi:MAG: cupin domain-containing protein [Planctomycetota bacterium]